MTVNAGGAGQPSTPTETFTPAAMTRMDSPRWRRARMAARLSSSTTGRRPPARPWRRAASRPSLVLRTMSRRRSSARARARSRIRDRSVCSPAAMPSSTLTPMPRSNRPLSTISPSRRLRPSRSTSCTVSRSPSRTCDRAASRAGRSAAASLPLTFSSNTLRQTGSRASCCRLVFCLSPPGLLLVGADPDEADERHGGPPFVHQT